MKLKDIYTFFRKRLSTQSSPLGLSLCMSSYDLSHLYKLDSLLGFEGRFGVVHSGVRRKDGLRVAVKEVEKSNICPNMMDEGMLLEVSLLMQVAKVPGVIRLLDNFESGSSFYIVMERLEGRELYDFISSRGALGEQVAQELFGQVVETVVGCQEMGVFHGDINDENIIVEKTETGLQCILIDFGRGTWLNELQVYTQYEGRREYAPPEWLGCKGYWGEALTVWSLGVLLYNMLCGVIPFKTDQEILMGKLIWWEELGLSTMARDLVTASLNKDCTRRLTLQEVRNHTWLTQEVQKSKSML
jgi:serine/threonine protein kinase